MEIKKLNKKGASIRDLLIVILGFVMAFGIIIGYTNQFANEGNATIDPQFNKSYTALKEQETGIKDLVYSMQNETKNLKEASLGDYAFFGIKGVLTLMQLPLKVVNIGYNSVGLVTPLFNNVPDSMKIFISLVMMVIVTFAIIKFITSRGQEP